MSQSKNVLKEFGGLQVGGAPISSKANYADLTAASTLTIADSGKTFYLNSATEFATTLPAVASAAGFEATFFVKAAPSGASYTIASPAADIHAVITAAQDAGGSSASTAGTAITTITLADGVALAGDYVKISCDGTNYFAIGASSAYNAITLA